MESQINKSIFFGPEIFFSHLRSKHQSYFFLNIFNWTRKTKNQTLNLRKNLVTEKTWIKKPKLPFKKAVERGIRMEQDREFLNLNFKLELWNMKLDDHYSY